MTISPEGVKSPLPHETRPVFILADVDLDIAPMVEYLQTIKGVRTQASCQGTRGQGGPNPYRPQVMATWTLATDARLRSEFDVTELGTFDPTDEATFWGYLHPRDRWIAPLPAAVGEGAVERHADEHQEVVAALYKAWPDAEDVSSDWPFGIIGSIEQIIAERDDARKRVPAYNEQELDNLIAEGWSRDHAEWAAHLSRRLTESMMECAGLSGRLHALSEAAAPEPSTTPEDATLDHRLIHALAGLEHTRTTDQLIAGLMRQVRRLKDEG